MWNEKNINQGKFDALNLIFTDLSRDHMENLTLHTSLNQWNPSIKFGLVCCLTIGWKKSRRSRNVHHFGVRLSGKVRRSLNDLSFRYFIYFWTKIIDSVHSVLCLTLEFRLGNAVQPCNNWKTMKQKENFARILWLILQILN